MYTAVTGITCSATLTVRVGAPVVEEEVNDEDDENDAQDEVHLGATRSA